MATLLDLKTEIAAKLLDPDFTATSADSVVATINQSVAYWKRRPFWFNEAASTQTLTTGDPTITLPSDFYTEIMPAGFVVIDNESRYVLQKITPLEYDNINIESTGRPRFYVELAGQYLAYDYPDQDYSISIRYLKDYAALSGDSDYNDFTVYADRLICYDALARAHGEYRQDEKMEAYYSARAEDEYKQLLAMNNRKIGSGRLVVRSILTPY